MDNKDVNIISSGHLAVGDGHQLYYEQWGNPDGAPTMFLHGGPGGSIKDRYKLVFDPQNITLYSLIGEAPVKVLLLPV